MRTVISSVLFSLLAVCMFASTASATNYNLTGKVKFKSDGALVTSEKITGNDLTTLTTRSSDAYFCFNKIPSKCYTLRMVNPAYTIVGIDNSNSARICMNNKSHYNKMVYVECSDGYERSGNKCVKKKKFDLTGVVKFKSDGTLVTSEKIDGNKGLPVLTTRSTDAYFCWNDIYSDCYTLSMVSPAYKIVGIDNSTSATVCMNNQDQKDKMVFVECADGYVRENGKCVKQTKFKVVGHAYFEGTNERLPGVTVKLQGFSDKITNQNGWYGFYNVMDGTRTLTAMKTGYTLVRTNFTSPLRTNKDHTNKNFYFACAKGFEKKGTDCVEKTYTIMGNAFFEGTTTAVPNTTVVRTSGNDQSSTSTDSNGKYTFTKVNTGTHAIECSTTAANVVPANPADNFGGSVTIVDKNLNNKNCFFKCADGFTLENGECVDGPIVIEASDGTFDDFVRVIWTTDECAESYQLFRALTGEDVASSPLTTAGNLPAESGTTQTYDDASAVPGVTYDYLVVAINSSGDICNTSNIDPGFRNNDFMDCDGDGVSDEDEIAQGTDPCDSGSFQPQLKSPACTKWNTFLSQWNFLEVVGKGTVTTEAVVTVYDINGLAISTQALSLENGEQIDVDINTLAGVKDTYGLACISWNADEGGQIMGRMVNYRPDPNGTSFSFAFAKELINPVMGTTYATANSIDPQGKGFLVPNWTEIQNVSDRELSFTYNLYNAAGELVENYTTTVPSFGERDLNAGHENGQGAYLIEVIPHDGAGKYFMTVSRYSSNQAASDEADTYNFAFARQGQKGTADFQYVTVANESGGCFSTTNWVEIVNTTDKMVTVDGLILAQDGTRLGHEWIMLKPREQYHINAGAYFAKGQRGTMRVLADVPSSVLAQSITYYHDCESNLVQTAFMAQGRIAGAQMVMGSYNRFIGLENRLNVFNTANREISPMVELFQAGTPIYAESSDLFVNGGATLELNNESVFSTSADTYGSVTVTCENTGEIVAEVLRERRDPNNPDKIDFIIHTPLY